MTSFIPSSTTGFIQACDIVVNKFLKARTKELAHQYIDKHELEWVSVANSTRRRRKYALFDD